MEEEILTEISPIGEKQSFYVYLLESTDKATYVGATVNPDHRLRQHNCEISGGAHATRMRVINGSKWRRVCYIENFPTWQSALQFEWRFKQISRKKELLKLPPLKRRLIALEQLLALDKSTTKAVPYSEWTTPPHIVWEMGMF